MQHITHHSIWQLNAKSDLSRRFMVSVQNQNQIYTKNQCTFNSSTFHFFHATTWGMDRHHHRTEDYTRTAQHQQCKNKKSKKPKRKDTTGAKLTWQAMSAPTFQPTNTIGLCGKWLCTWTQNRQKGVILQLKEL
uniref:Uncharacterized protein n=1 Tax=Anguilla anguilla TaxID=7936 RepID=A0A0E9Q6J3_ANGAN